MKSIRRAYWDARSSPPCLHVLNQNILYWIAQTHHGNAFLNDRKERLLYLGEVWCLHPDSLVEKESAWNAGDPSSIPRSGRSAGEGKTYALQYFGAFLVTQLVKKRPAMRETWVCSPDWEDPLEKGKATHSSILAQRIPWTVQSMGSQKVRHDWVTFTLNFCMHGWVPCCSPETIIT